MSDEWPKPIEPPEIVQQLAKNAGGTIEECAMLPDGSGFATMSMPLPKDHWSTVKATEYESPPMRWRLGEGDTFNVTLRGTGGIHSHRVAQYTREQMAELIREAGKYAYRSATMGGTEPDLDPDALLQNLVTAFIGYWSSDGRTDDEWALPPYERGKR